MYGNNRNRRGFRAKRKISSTKRAYLAGIRRGKAIARGRARSRRWY